MISCQLFHVLLVAHVNIMFMFMIFQLVMIGEWQEEWQKIPQRILSILGYQINRATVKKFTSKKSWMTVDKNISVIIRT